MVQGLRFVGYGQIWIGSAVKHLLTERERERDIEKAGWLPNRQPSEWEMLSCLPEKTF